MSTFNYRDMTFEYYRDGSDDYSSYQILSTSFLDYHHRIRSATIKCQYVGRKEVWVAEFSGLTTEYSGSLNNVLKKVYDHYQQNSIHNHEDTQNE